MRRSPVPTLTLVLGLLLLMDVLRVWLPSIITIFGQAAATPAELLAAFALSWFLLAFGAPPLVRLIGSGPVALASAVVLAACRIALPATEGGTPQLYTASAGLLAGLVWLAATAAATPRPVPGLVLGLAGGTVVHTALGTYDLLWRSGLWVWVGTVAGALLFVTATVHGLKSGYQPRSGRDNAPRTGPGAGAVVAAGGAGSWLLLGPALLLSGMISGSPALLSVALSYGPAWLPGDDRSSVSVAQPASFDHWWAALLGTVATTAFVAGGLLATPERAAASGSATARGSWRWVGAGLLVAGALLFAMAGPAGLVPAILATAAGLGIALGATDRPESGADPRSGTDLRSGARRGFAAVGGMAVFAVAAVLYYAAYDLGYPNQWVPVAVALLIAAVAVTGPRLRAAPAGTPRPSTGSALAPPDPAGPVARGRWRRRLVPAAALVAALAGLTAAQTGRPPAAVDGRVAESLAGDDPVGGGPVAGGAVGGDAVGDGAVRLVAYNIRMGFGLDGRFDLDGLADVIAGERPDVVALSEVDRAWLLNGGHDLLALLARRLDLPYVFAPAADNVWGDAVLTRMPVRAARTEVLPALGAPTGAQALAVVLDAGGRELVVISTHFQPPPGGGPVAQAEATARFATTLAAGRPLVVAGDLNTEPGEPAFEALRSAGLTDALAAARPLPTSPADEPAQQIDHVLMSPGLTATDAVAPRSTASDHLPVAVTLTLPST